MEFRGIFPTTLVRMDLFGLQLADVALVLSWDLPELRESAFSLHPEDLDLSQSDFLLVGDHGCNALESVRFICDDLHDDPYIYSDVLALWLCGTLPPQIELAVRLFQESDRQTEWTREVEAKYREQRQRENHDGLPLGAPAEMPISPTPSANRPTEEPAADSIPGIADASHVGPTSIATSAGATEQLLQQILESNLRQEGLLQRLLDRS